MNNFVGIFKKTREKKKRVQNQSMALWVYEHEAELGTFTQDLLSLIRKR